MSNVSLRFLSWSFFLLNCLYTPMFLVQLGGFLSSPYMACVRALKYGRFYDSLMGYTIIFGLFAVLNLCFLCIIYLLNRNIVQQGAHSAPLIWGAGVYASTQIDSGQSNQGFTINANKAKGSSQEIATTHTNTQITVGGTTVNDIGGNLILDGANLDTKHLTVTVGGDLIVKSRQDTYQYTHDQ